MRGGKRNLILVSKPKISIALNLPLCNLNVVVLFSNILNLPRFETFVGCLYVSFLSWLLLTLCKHNHTYFSQTFLLAPRFAINISSRNPRQARELTEELLPVNSKSNIKLNATVCLSVICITCKNQRLTTNWWIAWLFRLTNRLSMARCADWLHYGIRKLLDWSSDWLRAISDGMNSVGRAGYQWRND